MVNGGRCWKIRIRIFNSGEKVSDLNIFNKKVVYEKPVVAHLKLNSVFPSAVMWKIRQLLLGKQLDRSLGCAV